MNSASIPFLKPRFWPSWKRDCWHFRGSIPLQPTVFSARGFSVLRRWTLGTTCRHSTRTWPVCRCCGWFLQMSTLSEYTSEDQCLQARTCRHPDDIETSWCGNTFEHSYWHWCTRWKQPAGKGRTLAWFLEQCRGSVARDISERHFMGKFTQCFKPTVPTRMSWLSLLSQSQVITMHCLFKQTAGVLTAE